jgi:hypothetical protein
MLVGSKWVNSAIINNNNNNNNNNWKARYQGIAENNHSEHSTHTLESTNVRVQNFYHGK